MKSRVSILTLLLALAAVAQQDNLPPVGSIYGIAIGTNGQPASRVGLTAVPLGVPLGTPLPHTTTNDRGEYRFGNLWWGKYTVYAEDEGAGYSGFSTGTFGQTDPSEIEITPARPEAELRVQIPPKAAFLEFNLKNKRTGAHISSLVITVLHPSSPPTLAFSEGCYSTKIVLLPPDQDLLIHISSKGFDEWNESVGGGKLIHLHSGTHLTLDVALEPSDLGSDQEARDGI